MGVKGVLSFPPEWLPMTLPSRGRTSAHPQNDPADERREALASGTRFAATTE